MKYDINKIDRIIKKINNENYDTYSDLPLLYLLMIIAVFDYKQYFNNIIFQSNDCTDRIDTVYHEYDVD